MALHLLTGRHCTESGPPAKAPTRAKPALCIEAKRTLNACAQTRRRIGVADGGDQPGSASCHLPPYRSHWASGIKEPGRFRHKGATAFPAYRSQEPGQESSISIVMLIAGLTCGA